MKRLYILLAFMFCATTCFCQFPVSQTIGSPSTQVYSKGGMGFDSLVVFRTNFTDTSQANKGFLKNISGGVIRANDTLWVRNNGATKWVKLGNSVTATPTWQQTLNESSLLLVDNVVDVNSTNLSFNNAQSFTVYNDAASTTRLKLSQTESDLFSVNGSSGLNITNSRALMNVPTQIRTSDSVGTRFSFNFGSGSLSGWSPTLPNTTTAFDANGTTFTATGGMNLNNHIDQGFTIGVPNWTVYKQKVVCSQKDHLSYGFWFRFSPVAGNGQSLVAHFLLADTTGYIAFGTNNAVPDATYPNNRPNLTFKWNVGDTLEITVQRQDRNAIMSMKNMTTGLTSKMTYSVAITGTVAMSVGFYGGIWKFLNTYDFRYNEIKIPALIGLGNSLMWGANASTQDSTYFNLIASSIKGGSINMGHPSETAANGVQNVTDIVTYLQADSHTVCLVEYGVNEHNGAVPLATFGTNLRSICTSLLAAGIKVVLVNCVPQSTSIVSYNDTINSVANSFTPHIRVADIYTALVGSGTTINSIYAYGDGIHINNRGSVVCAGVINKQIQDLVTYGSPLNVSPLPTISNPAFFVSVDQNNNFGRSFFGSSNAYIKNSGTPSTSNVQTPGDIDISGTIWGGTSLAIGGTGSIQVNPNFSVNILAPGYTSAALFTSQNFTTSATTSTFDGSGGSRINFTNAPPLNFFAVGANIVHNNGTSTYNTRFSDNGNGMAITNGNYNYIELWRNNFTTKVLDLNRGGGGDFDSLLKYTHPMRSIYDNLTLVDKRYVDSTVAAGGGFVSPLTTTGDIIYSSSGSTAARLGIGGSNQVLTVIGGIPSWQNSAAGFSNPMTTTGDIIYSSNNSGTAVRLGVGSNGQFLTLSGGIPAWATVSASTNINGLGAATGTNDIDNTQYRQRWRWTTLAGDTAVVINSTATTAASNAQVGEAVMLKGANATSSQTTKALYVENSHTGTGAINIGVYAQISGASTTSRAGYFDGGITLRATDLTAPHLVWTNSSGTIEWREASAQLTGSGNGDWVLYNGVTTNGGAGGVGVLLDYQTLNLASYGGATTLFQPSAKFHAASGNASSGTAPLKLGFIAPVLNTVAEKYALEIDSTTSGGNIYYTNAGATRYTLAKTLTNTATLDFGSTAAGSTTDLTITVTGAADGDVVDLGVPNGSEPAGTNEYNWRAWVSSANTITVRFLNMNTVTAIDPASGTFRVAVLKY